MSQSIKSPESIAIPPTGLAVLALVGPSFRYSLPSSARVKLEVFDVRGRKVATLIDERQARGVYSVVFNAENVASGFYYYRLQAGNSMQFKRMLLLK